MNDRYHSGALRPSLWLPFYLAGTVTGAWMDQVSPWAVFLGAIVILCACVSVTRRPVRIMRAHTDDDELVYFQTSPEIGTTLETYGVTKL